MFGSILAQTPLFSYETNDYKEHVQVEYEDVPIMLDNQGEDYKTCTAKYNVNIVVLHLLYGDIYSTPKKGFISKSSELK
jgi:CO dehydrogenase/acetyl-CoA synthase delta subunit